MKIYLAARYDRLNEMQEVKALLEENRLEVTSRWVNGNHNMDSDGFPSDFGQEDWIDLEGSDVVVSFSEKPEVGYNRGGRHVEFGMGLAYDKLMVVVGGPENVFHHLPWVFHYDKVGDFVSAVKDGSFYRYASQSRGNAKTNHSRDNLL